jgi:hypothetical protein
LENVGNERLIQQVHGQCSVHKMNTKWSRLQTISTQKQKSQSGLNTWAAVAWCKGRCKDSLLSRYKQHEHDASYSSRPTMAPPMQQMR